MKVLVINCGSSTIKYQLIDMEKDNVIAKGRCDMIGYEKSNMIYTNVRDNIKNNFLVNMPTHKEAMQVLLNTLLDKDTGVLKSLDEIYAVGHRVVHGGDKFSSAALVNDEVINKINELSELAPLHNPGAVMGIQAIMEVAPLLKNVVVFDTAFHQTIPDYNYLYALNPKYYEKYGIRKYGFHGTSYMYILNRLTEILNKPKKDINAIICHLGSGASCCAIRNGKSYDTSMGFTPHEGLVMETRCGDIDATAVTKIMEKENLTPAEMEKILNKESGRVGLCGIGDQRELISAANSGNKQAMLTRKIQCNRTRKYIGAYMAELNRVDAIVFTGGVAENNFCERLYTIQDMDCLGIKIDKDVNFEGSGKETKISASDSKIPVYVIPTNEELEIAKQTVEVVSQC